MTNKFFKEIRIESKNIFFNVVFLILNVLVVITLYKNNLLTFLILLVIALIGLFKWKSKLTLIIFICVGIIGPLLESLSISFGAWSYSSPDILNIPLWLLILWGNAGAFIYQTTREIKKLGVKG